MEFRVLGSLAAVADGATVELGPPKQRALLALMLMHVGEIMPVDRLIDLLWGDDAPRTAPHSIQIYVSDLRKALETVGGSDLIVTRPPGYALEADRDSIDAWRFERLVHDGARMLESGDREQGRQTLRHAMDLWRGPVLSDFAYEEFAQPYIRRLTDLHLDAIEILASAELDSGREPDAMSLLTTAVREDPLRERSRELLMLALYRSGRHADALRTFDQLKTQLVEELGIDPSPQIRSLYDRILLHDPTLLPEPMRAVSRGDARNPFKGLRAFTEGDAEDFFGREQLVSQLVDAMAGGARLVSLVGPSGSGKSSAVAAGLVPRLRAGEVPGSAGWRVNTVVPGATPTLDVQELLRSGPDLVVVDQFEQAFTALDGESRDAFLQLLADEVQGGRVRIVLTLRADYYDRPLLHPAFAGVFTPSVVNVVPMTAGELERAIVEPARRVGVAVEPGLLAELVADTADRPGSLPLLQYALTELFERRTEPVLTRASFAKLGGLRGLLSRQAESIYGGLSDAAQAAATQVFLRLVRVGTGSLESRRRVALRELTDLGIEPVVLSEVLTTFGRHRLLTFDRDRAADQATVEVAHEALLVEWERLAGWIERHRADLRRHGALLAAAEEWEQSGRNLDYLFSGSRLQDYEPWLSGGVIQLSGSERAFLEAAVQNRQAAGAESAARLEAQRRRERRARSRLLALGAVVFVLAGTLAYALISAIGAPNRTVALLTSGGAFDEYTDTAFDRAVADFNLIGKKARADTDAAVGALERLSQEDPALVIVSPYVASLDQVARNHPGVRYLSLNDSPSEEPNVSTLVFRVWEASYLAGVAAALTSETGAIGLVGGADVPPVWWFTAGYEAGAKTVDPTIDVRSVYLEIPNEEGALTDIGFSDDKLAEKAAGDLYSGGADVVMQVAGTAGLGVFEAAADMSESLGRQLWAIGVDSDQYDSVTRLPGVTRDDAWRPHILTSVLKRFDLVVYNALKGAASGNLPPRMQIYDLQTGFVDITYDGGFIDGLKDVIDGYRLKINTGQVMVPCIPDDRLFVVQGLASQQGQTLDEALLQWCP